MTQKKTIFSSSDIQSKFPLKDTSLTGSGNNGISNKYWDFLDDAASKLKGGDTHKYGWWKFTSQNGGGQDDLKK